jgi:hypothetical protein
LADTVAFVKVLGIEYETYPVGIHVREDAHVNQYPIFEDEGDESADNPTDGEE